VTEGGLTDGKLLPGDRIVEVDGGLVADMLPADTRALLRRTGATLSLSVKRKSHREETIVIERQPGLPLGLHIGATKDSECRHTVPHGYHRWL